MAANQFFPMPQAAGRRTGFAPAGSMRGVALGAILASTLASGGCVVSGPDPDALVDSSLITGSIAPPPDAARDATQSAKVPPLEQLSDQRIVRNAVSAADIADKDGRFAWANPQTGASGVISALQENRTGSTICRRFQTSRQRFDGIALYHGEACSDGEGEWALVSFSENGA